MKGFVQLEETILTFFEIKLNLAFDVQEMTRAFFRPSATLISGRSNLMTLPAASILA